MAPAKTSGERTSGRRFGAMWRRPGRVSLISGTLVAAAGLIFGGVSTAYANGSASHHPDGQPASDPFPPPNAPPPAHGDSIPNVTTVESQIEAYYGSVAGTMPGG